MKLLIIGYSKLFKNRLIPALNLLAEEFEDISVAKYSDQEWDNELKKLIHPKIALYDSYVEGITKSNANLAYITSINSDHYNSAKITLLGKMHTIVDKPATLNIDQLMSLYYSSTPNLLLAEALVYLYHPQFQKIKDILEQYDSRVRTINVLFSIPPLDINNFRYKKELGGGVINDMGPYAVSIGRYFFDEEPKEIHLSTEKINTSYKDSITYDLDISFDVIFKYSGNKSVIGHFGFTSQYANSMTILSNKVKIEVDRVFTIPDDKEQEIKITTKAGQYIEKVEKANNFYLFFKDVLNAIKTEQYIKFKDTMIKDCKTLELLRRKI